MFIYELQPRQNFSSSRGDERLCNFIHELYILLAFPPFPFTIFGEKNDLRQIGGERMK